MIHRPLASIALTMIGLAALPVAAGVAAFAATGRSDWALGLFAGWLAGSLNAGLLAIRVSRLTARSTVAAFLYGTASRFAFVGLILILAYRLLGANAVGFAIGLALVILMNVPVSLIWSMRQELAR
jgi:hypothetical protein